MIDIERLIQLLKYDEVTGEIFWRDGLKRNSRSGMRAGCITNNGRYKRILIRVDGVLHLAHRLAWCIYYGSEPRFEIDHIDGNPLNNKICNLRDVSSGENSMNTKIPVTNTSGFLGVGYDSTNKKWRAKIKVKGKTICLGRYAEISDAIRARVAANKKYGFHENHGRLNENL